MPDWGSASMAEKKKIVESKTVDRRMSKPQGPRPNVKTPEPIRSAGPRGGAAAPQTAAAVPTSSQTQLGTFEAAMRLFHARNLGEARTLFQKAAEGPERDVANRARLHMSMCDRRLEQVKPTLGSAEDYYNYGVALLNTRNVPEARVHLEQALQMAPGSEHIHYALALAQALSGDLAAAHQNLSRSIELQPRNRQLARQDTDLAPLANQPPFDGLLYPEKKGW
jgi:Flp pilus assembly protein TadD